MRSASSARETRTRTSALAVVSLLLSIAAAPAATGPLEDAQAAYKNADYATALWLIRPLADEGKAEAQFVLGDMYDLGHGVPQNYGEAAKWYRLAADQGFAAAQTNLGAMYLTGSGILVNYVLAYKWFTLAAKAGDREAANSRDFAAQFMTRVQITEAQELVREWKPQLLQLARRDDVVPTFNVPSQDPSSRMRVPLKIEGGVLVVPVELNSIITLGFIIDSGAADVSVPADVFSTLRRTGTIKEADFIGQQTYLLADGSKSQSTTFTIRSLKLGDVVVENVRGSVAPSEGSLLLGQSFLGRFKSWSIDNATHELVLGPFQRDFEALQIFPSVPPKNNTEPGKAEPSVVQVPPKSPAPPPTALVDASVPLPRERPKLPIVSYYVRTVDQGDTRGKPVFHIERRLCKSPSLPPICLEPLSVRREKILDDF